MADSKDDDRYEHQFEDLNGNPEDDNTEVDLGNDDSFLVTDGDDASRDAAGDDDQGADQGEDLGADGQEAAKKPAATGERDEEQINRDIDAALDRQRSQARDNEMHSLREELAQLRADQAKKQQDSEASQVDNEIAEARRQMAAANDEGDAAKAAEHQDRLVDLRIKKAMQSNGRNEQERPAPANQRPGAQAQPQVPDAARRWVSRNPWFSQGQNQQAGQTALVIEGQLRAAGYDPNDDALYAKVDELLAKRHPELGLTPAAPAQPAATQQPNKRRAAPTNGMGAQAPASNRGKVTITREDRNWMTRTGLDPDNPDHMKAWAREKRAEAARAGS